MVSTTLHNISMVRRALKSTVQILSGKDIQVRSSGLRAYVQRDDRTGKPKLVNIPSVPDNCSTELLETIVGFLDKEVGKILFSDFPLQLSAHKKGETFEKLFTALDSIHTDAKFQNEYKGSIYNMHTMYEFYLSKHIQKHFEVATENKDANAAIVALLLPTFRALAGRSTFQHYMDHGDKWQYVASFLGAIPDETIQKVKDLTSTQSAFDLTQEIMDCFDSDSEGESEGESESGSSSGSGSSKTTSSGSSGSKSPDDGGSSSPESDSGDDDKSPPEEKEKPKEPETDEDWVSSEPDEPSEDESDESKPKDDSDESEGSDKDSSDADADSGDDSDEDGDGDSTAASDSSSDGSKDDESEKEPPKKPSMPDLSEHDDNVSDVLADQLSSKMGDNEFFAFSTDFDFEGKPDLSSSYQEQWLVDMEDETDAMVGPMANTLQRVFTARTQDRWQSGLRKGKYHQKKAARVSMGDERVMRRRQASQITSNVAVSLVVDCSGSMAGGRIETAMSAALALSKVLDRLKITHEVSGFTTTRSSQLSRLIGSAKRSELKGVRHEALHLPIWKDYHERLSIANKALMADAHHGGVSLQNNVDGESVQRAALRLLSMNPSADQHTMIVLSDGEPAAFCDGDLNKHLVEVIQQCTDSGINTVGIGIQTRAVERFYPKSVVLQDLSKLPEVVVSELRDQLLG